MTTTDAVAQIPHVSTFVRTSQGYKSVSLRTYRVVPTVGGYKAYKLRYTVYRDSYIDQSTYRVEIFDTVNSQWNELWTIDPHTYPEAPKPIKDDRAEPVLLRHINWVLGDLHNFVTGILG